MHVPYHEMLSVEHIVCVCARFNWKFTDSAGL